MLCRLTFGITISPVQQIILEVKFDVYAFFNKITYVIDEIQNYETKEEMLDPYYYRTARTHIENYIETSTEFHAKFYQNQDPLLNPKNVRKMQHSLPRHKPKQPRNRNYR